MCKNVNKVKIIQIYISDSKNEVMVFEERLEVLSIAR